MRVSEWIAVAYFVGLALATTIVPVGARTRLAVAAIAVLAACLVVALIAVADAAWWLALARDWAPAAYLMVGYWLPGGLQRPPNPRLETWLMMTDRRLFEWLGPKQGRVPTEASVVTSVSPPWYGAMLEAVYVLVYPFVPACFLLLYVTAPSEASDVFWSAVLVSGYACYGTLPWLPARPPRQVEANERSDGPHARAAVPRSRAQRLLRLLNERVSGSMGVGGDTLPSGHVAVAVAAALVVAQFLPVIGALLIALTLLIATATVVGRYHYAVDAVSGLAVGALAWLVLTWMR
ncbi:MAG: phosphatase PAP2 family protein [Luteitalea sp.]|nr:phosphatase PAP2 family protein [Luteitalea sp.]